MPFPRVRVRLRTLMIAVAVVGVLLAILKANALLGAWVISVSLTSALWVIARKRQRRTRWSGSGMDFMKRLAVFLGLLAVSVILNVGTYVVLAFFWRIYGLPFVMIGD